MMGFLLLSKSISFTAQCSRGAARGHRGEWAAGGGSLPLYLLGAGGWELNARLPWCSGVVEVPW